MRTRRAVAIAILLTSTAIPALAQTQTSGGAADEGTGGAGGASSATAAGNTGGTGSGAGGGGGGAGATGGGGGTDTFGGGAGGSGGAANGGNGGAGAAGIAPGDSGGGGGGGGHGAIVITSTTNSGTATGGNGGGGGLGNGGGGGGGGAGGYGVVANGAGLTYTNNATGAVTAGAGGAGGAGMAGGNGGGGGYGIFFTASGTLNNSGTITGGSGGAGGAAFGANGLGGVGRVGSGLTIINSGSITGGLDGDGVTREDAIQFTGGSNTLTLQSGYSITGNVVAFSTADILALGGSSNASFDVSAIGPAAQYQGFGVFAKTGSSTWTLTNTTTAVTNWTVAGGTLSISSNGNLGAASSTLALENGTTLAFTASGTYSHAVSIAGDPSFDIASGQTVTYSGAITDGASAGTLEKIDSGTLILTAANTYTGGSTLAAGTLQVTGSGTLGGNSGSVTVSGGTLDLGTTTQTQNGGVTLASGTIQNGTLSSSGTFALQSGSVSAALTGGGTLDKTTSGTVTLSGANGYTGGTTVSAGTLQTTGSGTLGAATGSVTVSGGTLDLGTTTQTQNGGVTLTSGTIQNGTLSSSGTFTLHSGTVSAVLAGSGAASVAGGTVTLSGANTYTGLTTIGLGGTLALSGAGSIAHTSGVIDNGTFSIASASGGVSITSLSGGGGAALGANTLTLTSASSADILGAITGTGGLTLSGGNETLSGTNTYTGTTTISGGTLTVIGSLAGPVTVAGGKLNGTGTVGAVSVASGGTLAPGDAIGVLHVNGAVNFASGSTYAVEVSPTAADETIATGAITIASGTTLAVNQDAGTYTAHDYTLISAASISGTFATVTGDTFSGLNSTIQYSATGVDLILTAVPPPAPVTFLFGTFGKSPDQVAVGDAVTAGPATGALYTTLGGVVTSNTAAVPATLAQLSGDIHASLRSAIIEDGKIIRDTVIDHAIAGSDGITVWGAGFGAYGTMDGASNAGDVHHNDSGVIMGADMPVMDNVNVGVGIALTGQRIAVPNESATASGGTNHVIGYADWTDSQWVASLGWDYGWGANQVTRAITQFSETDSDHQSNRLGQVFGEVGYRIPSEIMALEPYLDLANVSARTGAFTETGGIAALDGGAKSNSESYATFGARATLPAISLEGIAMVPDFNLGWQHAFNRFASTQTLVFAGTGENFAVSGVPLDSDTAAIQAGLDFILMPTASLDIGYDGEVSSRVQDHAVRADLAWRL